MAQTAAVPPSVPATAAPAPRQELDPLRLPTIADLIPVADLKPAVDVKPAADLKPAAPEPLAEPFARFEEPPDTNGFDDLAAVRTDIDFEDEDARTAPEKGSAATPPRSRVKLVAAAVLACALLGGAYFGVQKYRGSSVPQTGLGTLVVQSSPPGVEVFIDGESRGMTPSTLSLTAGSHILELRGRGVPRVIPLQVPAGGQISQYLEFADTPATGMLVVHSQPVGAKVSLDGVAKGVTPLTLEGLAPGDHEVVLQSEAGSSRHVVKILAGTTASLVAPIAAAPTEGPISGWISVKAPFTIEIREEGQLLGTSEMDRLMLAAGRHNLELVNAALGFREPRVVQVLPGKLAALTVDLPKGSVNLNASPWAEVWIDGRRVGETPIGNLEVPIGPHEVVFRHPQFGEKRHAIAVTAAAPVRLSVSMK
jgi:hypothetical protein